MKLEVEAGGKYTDACKKYLKARMDVEAKGSIHHLVWRREGKREGKGRD
jgi:hypothetical protein